MWVKLGWKVSREEFNDATILFLLKSRAEHLSVLSEVCSFIMGTTGLVLAPDCQKFFRYEFLRRGSSEVPVAIWAIPNRGDVSLDCFKRPDMPGVVFFLWDLMAVR